MRYSIASLSLSFSENLPAYLPRCYLDDPKLNECVLKAFNEIRPHVSNGIAEIGLPPLNPFIISKLSVEQDTSLAKYTVTGVNYTTRGLDNYDIKEFQYDCRTMTFRFRIEFDSILMTSLYEVHGHLAHIPVEGKGLGSHAYSPVNAVFEINGGMRKLRGINYYDTKYVNVTLDMGEGSYHLDGLFDNKQLERMTNEMLNINSDMVVKALTPALEKIAKIAVMRFMKTLFKIPYHKLFPQSASS
ncbi:hypothetical protein ILUMI_05753 [Ignelater luminosus]|uniref:Protein takeout n=1 Tax=Ignelater luminosus TaxID=2038154 RepID=A0A8K0GIE3_IGNLU|nr:hypothetical protein ILUMI_05753 [Ignelater luminosus]